MTLTWRGMALQNDGLAAVFFSKKMIPINHFFPRQGVGSAREYVILAVGLICGMDDTWIADGTTIWIFVPIKTSLPPPNRHTNLLAGSVPADGWYLYGAKVDRQSAKGVKSRGLF